jgi:2-haloacid dehalogenase
MIPRKTRNSLFAASPRSHLRDRISTMLDFTRFEILTFDCYGTLINWEAGILSALHRILSAHGKRIDDGTLLKLYGDFELRSEQGTFQPYREVLSSVVQQFGSELGFTPTAAQVSSLPDSLRTWKPWPDTVTALRKLKTRFRLAILSNVDDDLFAATRPQLEVDFDEIITAQQAQAYKPSLKLFELALRRINAPSHRVLHVGQSIYHDVIPAQTLGLATVWVNRPSARPGVGAVISAEANPDLTVSSLEQLAAAALNNREINA